MSVNVSKVTPCPHPEVIIVAEVKANAPESTRIVISKRRVCYYYRITIILCVHFILMYNSSISYVFHLEWTWNFWNFEMFTDIRYSNYS